MAKNPRLPVINLTGQPDHVWMRAMGESLYGESYLRPFAKALGIAHTTLLPLVREKDPRPLTMNMRVRLRAFMDEKYDLLIQEHRNRLVLMVHARDHFAEAVIVHPQAEEHESEAALSR